MKKIIKITLLVLFGIIIISTFFFLWNKSRVKEPKYNIISPEVKTIQKKIVITGKVEPRNEVAIKPQISGIIDEIYKKEGDLVKVGDIIAKVKVIPDINQLNSGESRVNNAKISFDQEKANFERMETLYQSKVVSKEVYEQALTAYRRAEEELQNAEESLEIIKKGISQRTAQYSNTLIKATVNGMILNIPVKVGNSVIQSNNFNDGTTIATIANMKDLIFVGKVDETEIGKIKVNDPVILSIGAMQDAKLSAKLEYIAPKGTTESGTTLFEIKAAIDPTEENTLIRSGYSANGEIIVQKADSVLAVPEYCVEYQNDSTFVYVETDNPEKEQSKFEKKAVKIGISDGFFVQIIEGVNKDAKIKGNIIKEDIIKGDLPK